MATPISTKTCNKRKIQIYRQADFASFNNLNNLKE